MLKNLIKYILLIFIAIVIGYVFSYAYKSFINIYNKVEQKNKKVNFLENNNNSKDPPSFCFQSAYDLSKRTKIELPKIIPLGTIPLVTKSDATIIDRYGFKNKDFVWDQFKHDFLILGDSVVINFNNSNKYFYSKKFYKQNIINLGCGGNGLLSSLLVLEQIMLTNYKFDNILFFLNLNNDFSKDTIREYNTKFFLKVPKVEDNLFINLNKYKQDYINFANIAFSKSTNDFSIKKEFYRIFKKDAFLKDFFKLINTNRDQEKVLLQDGTIISKSIIPEGYYNKEMYNIFLRILERLSDLKLQSKSNIIFVIVPSDKELLSYKAVRNNEMVTEKYFNYRYLKNTIISTIANYNLEVLDLYEFIKENDFKGFKNGHFTEKYYRKLNDYINNQISNNTHRKLKDFYFYNSFYPSKKYFNYQVNFGKKLSGNQVDNWTKSINLLMTKNMLDNYLLTPSLGYFFLNQDCDTIININKLTNNKLKSYTIGSFFFEICNLKYTKELSTSINYLNELVEGNVKYYIPELATEIKKSLDTIYENK